MIDYNEMSYEDFDYHLAMVIEEEYGCSEGILLVPGIYEVLSEFHNNDVLDRWAEGQKDKT